MKRCVLPFSSKNCNIQQCLMVFFLNRYNMRLKSPCEIASDMTLASPNVFENQLQATYAYNISQRPGLVSMGE